MPSSHPSLGLSVFFLSFFNTMTTKGRDGRTVHRHHPGRTSLIRLAAATGIGRLPLPISLCSPSPILAATFMPHRGRPPSFCAAAAACRSLVLAASFAFRSAQLRPPCCISWPLESIELSSSKDESSDAHCDHLPPSHVVAQVHSREFRATALGILFLLPPLTAWHTRSLQILHARDLLLSSQPQ